MKRTVAALAGRRVDGPDSAAVRFPAPNVSLVRGRIQVQLEHLGVQVLVCSAACGADLLALDVAGDLGIRRRVVLPAEPERFRRTSVVDRPGDWGPLFDRIIADLQARGDLVTFTHAGDDGEGYALANTRILDEAEEIGKNLGVEAIALIVWDGRAQGTQGFTEAFAGDAAQRGLRVLEISTLRTASDQ